MKFIALFLFTSTSVFASHVAVVSKLQGKVQLYAPVKFYPNSQGPHVLYNDKTYRIQEVKIGDKILNHMIVNTDKKSKAKIIYSNGDQIYVTPSSQYEINWEEAQKKEKVSPSGINLMYGAIRMMVDKKGERSGIKVKTRSSSFAVRGTDFHVAQSGSSGISQLSVLRGKVEVTAAATKGKVVPDAPVMVSSGKSAVSGHSQEAPKIISTSKQDLKQIAYETKVEMKEINASESVKIEIAKLEEKATVSVLKDIKESDPKLFEEITQQKVSNLDQINMKAVEKVYKTAPETKGKPSWRELDELESDPYGKYFKN
jgi:hypothetical protein